MNLSAISLFSLYDWGGQLTTLSNAERQFLIDLLESGEPIPSEFKNLLFPPQKQEYELVYFGKQRAEDVIADTMAVPLQPLRSFGTDNTGWNNQLIFGDNLQVTKTLLRMKSEKHLINSTGSQGIRLIYIDPPFATRHEFIGSDEEKAYQDKIIGAEFLEFLRQRLILLWELLADDGALFLHLDWKKGHYIKTLLDEICGESNFGNEIIWWYYDKMPTGGALLDRQHDTIFLYAKKGFRPNRVEEEREEIGRPTEVRKKVGGKMVRVRDEQGEQVFQGANTTKKISDVWKLPLLNSMAGERVGYPTQKPEHLLERIIQFASSPGDIVLDTFAGSGTTLAVAEKYDRRWIGVDCGKLAIYTIQKRILNLTKSVGQKGEKLVAKPFILYNAGLYDFSRLKELPWDGWRSYALGLFQCKDEEHKIKGITLDGYRDGEDVLVFNHRLSGGVVLDYGFIEHLHMQIGTRVSSRFYIIAPAASVAFLEDYIDLDSIRYYVLRIPYSIINELHSRDFEAITQPVDEAQVNDTVQSVGFDFIRQPYVECEYFTRQTKEQLFAEAVIRIRTFRSEALAKGASTKQNLESLSMVFVDMNYPHEPSRKGDEPFAPFELDRVFYANQLRNSDWEIRIPFEEIGDYTMLIYMDVYGNEYTEIKSRDDFTSSLD